MQLATMVTGLKCCPSSPSTWQSPQPRVRRTCTASRCSLWEYSLRFDCSDPPASATFTSCHTVGTTPGTVAESAASAAASPPVAAAARNTIAEKLGWACSPENPETLATLIWPNSSAARAWHATQRALLRTTIEPLSDLCL